MEEVMVIEDSDGNLVLPLSPEILEHLKVIEGDTLDWTVENETATLRKKND